MLYCNPRQSESFVNKCTRIYLKNRISRMKREKERERKKNLRETIVCDVIHRCGSVFCLFVFVRFDYNFEFCK